MRSGRKRSEKWSQRPGLRVRLTLLVAGEIVASVLIAAAVDAALKKTIFAAWNIPQIVELGAICLFVGVVLTAFLSRAFFEPIHKMGKAMEWVAKGDFSVCLETKSTAREIQEIYAGFNVMVRELGNTEIIQTDFVTNVSHEFKTPLSAIEGYSMLLQGSDRLTPQEQTYVEKIIFNAERMSTLTGSVLLLSKLEHKSIPTGRSTFRLDEQIRLSLLSLEPAWEKKELEFDVDMERVDYYGNEALLHHVWDNLIGNAVKFSEPGGEVRIRLTQRDGEIIATISDRGPGLSEEAQKHAFDKFYQADSSHKQEGSGLGLALVKKIVDLEGGKVSANSRKSGGCRVIVTLYSAENEEK